MASINLTGVLRDPTGEFAYLNKIRFTHTTTTGQTLKGFRSVHVIDDDGAYDIDIEYGNVFIESQDALNRNWIDQGTLTINSDTPATDLPSLLGITTPATDADLLVFQALVADAADSASAAALSESETQALFDNFDSSVAESLGEIGVNINWDVEIPFNDGGEIKSGYGDRNTYGNKAINFTRSSASSNINKSSVHEDLLVNEICIGSDGAYISGSSTNLVKYSNDLSNASWTTKQLSVIGTDSFAGVQMTELEDADAASSLRNGQVVSVDMSSPINLQAKIKMSDSDKSALYVGGSSLSATSYVEITWETDGSVGSVLEINAINVEVELISDGVHLVKYTIDPSIVTGTSMNLFLYPVGVTTGVTAVGSAYYADVQLTQSAFNGQYIETEAASVTRAPDIASITMMNNFPSTGKSFAVPLEVIIKDGATANRVLFQSSGGTSGGFTGAILTTGNKLTLRTGSENEGDIPLSLTAMNTGSNYIIISYNSETLTFSVYINNALEEETTLPSELVIYNDNDLYIGSANGSTWHLNSTIKNFRIKHSALTANQVKSLGSAL